MLKEAFDEFKKTRVEADRFWLEWRAEVNKKLTTIIRWKWILTGAFIVLSAIISFFFSFVSYGGVDLLHKIVHMGGEIPK